MRLKKRHGRDMIFNKKVGDLMDTKEQIDLKRNFGGNKKIMSFG